MYEVTTRELDHNIVTSDLFKKNHILPPANHTPTMIPYSDDTPRASHLRDSPTLGILLKFPQRLISITLRNSLDFAFLSGNLLPGLSVISLRRAL